MSQFFETAGRVIDIHQKRQKSLSFVSDLNKNEHLDAVRRMRENAHVVAIVQQSLADRVASYQFALERLVIITPSQQAIEAERSITLLQNQIARYLADEVPDEEQPRAPAEHGCREPQLGVHRQRCKPNVESVDDADQVGDQQEGQDPPGHFAY